MAKAKKEAIIATDSDNNIEVVTTPQRDCGCGDNHAHGYQATAPYTHTDGKQYLFKAYALRNHEGVELPAKQIFSLASGETLCAECLEEFPVLEQFVNAENKDNGKALATVNLLFARQSPFLSVVE